MDMLPSNETRANIQGALNNSLLTVNEAFKQYRTFSVNTNRTLPSVADLPDGPLQVSLVDKLSDDTQLVFQQQIYEITHASKTNQALITLHNQKPHALPRSHFHIEIDAEGKAIKYLNSMPVGKFVYELFLEEDSFYEYCHLIKIINNWTIGKESNLLITIPVSYMDLLQETFPELSLHEITRPFHCALITSEMG
jgi:hypothetical protein